MAEELSVPNSNNNGMLELAICQPEHPNQAHFVSDLGISLQDFRGKITESTLILPEEWVFMTRAGSLIATDQEENIQLNTITRKRDDSNALDVMISPSISHQRPPGGQPRAGTGGTPLASFATIVGALRDIYVTSIQPNMHELIKPLIIATLGVAALSFVLAMILTMCIGALGGVNRSLLAPFLRQHLCAEEIEFASETVPELFERINELETRLKQMRQVEVGSLMCKHDHHMYEEADSAVVHVPFRKTPFTDAPRVVFGLRGVSVDDFNTVRLEDLRVNSTGFSVKCSYFGKWMHYNMEFSWVAVGK